MHIKHALIIGFIGALLGCFAFGVSRATVADAQQPGQYRQCVAQIVDWARRASTVERNATDVPPGWTVVGGGGTSNGAVVIMCR